MVAGRWLAPILVISLAVTTFVPQVSASPARRLARRGIVVAPAPVAVAPAVVAVVPSPFLLRPAPLVVAALPPSGPTVVLGPRGRVRSVILPPVVPATPLAALTEAVAVEPSAGFGSVPSPGQIPQQATASSAAPPPGPLRSETIPAPLPTPRPAPTGDVQPAGVELDIPDGTRSVLVQPAGGEQPTVDN